MPGGRPTKYTPEIVDSAREYLVTYKTEHDHAIPSIIGMAIVLKVGKSTLYDWESDPNNEFSDILPLCMDHQHFRLIDGGLKGDLNSNICKLALGKHGYSDKQDIEHSGGVALREAPDEDLDAELKQLLGGDGNG